MNILKTNLLDKCPGGFCDYIQAYSEVLVVILCLDGFIFFVTLLPPLFSWSNKKADGRKRIYFAALACFTFYFWLAFLALNSLYCFGFMAHLGPCKQVQPSLILNVTVQQQSTTTTTSMPAFPTLPESNIERPAASTSPKLLASTSMASMMPTKYSSVSSTFLSSLKPSVNVIEYDEGQTKAKFMTFEPSLDAEEEQVFDEIQEEVVKTTRMVFTDEDISSSTTVSSTSSDLETKKSEEPVPMPLISWTSSDSKANSSCVQLANEHETQLKNLTLVNILIIVVLFIVFIANAREAMTAKALYHKETLCKREEVQRFLSSLVLKPPEVGHLINCFHMAKTNSDTRNKKANIAATAANLSKRGGDAKDAGPPRKVVTFSAIENFAYQTWRDFSDHRLIEPSSTYPIIEIEVMLNFFPGDHFTAEKYKAFVNHMTKTHSGKDQRITIDDYFHVEDHREWTFFIGNDNYITPWWDKDAAKIPLSCIFLLGWPFRMAYGGRIAKHQVEIKKAVFVENNAAADEGVSLSATPASEENAATAEEKKPTTIVESAVAVKKELQDDAIGEEDEEEIEDETQAMLKTVAGASMEAKAIITSTASSSNHEQFTEHRVNALVSSQPPPSQQPSASIVQHQPPPPPIEEHPNSDHQYFYQQMQVGPSIPTTRKQQQIPAFGHPLANVLPQRPVQQQPQPPQRSMRPSLRTLNEKQEVMTSVTAVTHQDINGVSTVAMKDLDVQMTAMSGYETYV